MTLKTFKKIVKWIVGLSTMFTVKNVIENNTTPENRRQKAEVWVGSAAIGQVVAAKTEAHAGAFIDSIVEGWNKNKVKNDEEAKTEQ
jgi:hypothetical protein